MKADYDIAIAGAGVVGQTLALLCARSGFRVALIDPREFSPRVGTDLDRRIYALTPASMRLLDRLGIGAALDKNRVNSFTHMHVWDGASDGELQFSAASLGRAHLGTIVEDANLLGAIERVRSTNSSIVRHLAAVDVFEQGDEEVALALSDGSRLRAALLFACDGANSPLREQLGLVTKEASFEQTALVCNVETTKPHGNVARQRFLKHGPLAFLPLPAPHACSIVWTTTQAQAEFAQAATDDQFLDLLSAAFGGALGSIRATTERHLFPLRALHVERYSVKRAVVLGDAAHVVHPLAGQGLNLGLMDAAALAQVFAAGDPLDLRFPSAALERFERMRRGENLAMLELTSALNRLFQDQTGLIGRSRGFGMTFVNRLVPLKNWLMLRAMGDIGDVPSLAALVEEI